MINLKNIDFNKLNGLVPAIVIHYIYNDVLMVGFMNEDALNKTLETKKVTFYSRSKNRLWTKGETSSNYLNLVDIKLDCDNDTLLIYAKPDGNTCHLNRYSCFDIQPKNINFLSYLQNIVNERKKLKPEESYTAKLFAKGKNKIIQKVGEEAVEVVIAVKNEDKNEIINETADLLYHLIVMLEASEINLSEVVDCLIKRHK
ncbi:MAG TPA: bifunctional phosphoribosyl-AMP cyclohydrolase/phosphoribosyl-ATP diphosphatase HisIE [Ignavibacteriales bacterium]|nr:bifunctional phosphoribosyl-AMP cyclohydrolase/phosphoribosyl-ATP diphosphatase HisIE [Ignavibacteriales bacterium]HOL81166.1 bifunctional phosphoribosyl-AMP cyclohydrolase/phosphoribosyl-ATP diphosphatase HisIE [Ignavibacteriales bacterium]HOM65269.1 bifunctional phosphoribosyl-AMP cyclohydrolase/phosphoribosyl-ATP diphosphatase HisIE [Ignavibacteriales bacterium]HPD66561.1 bifunctional phosphoribosyl-AMP cyclohydrolase/phosphoribosyl-ATP diphosphatase HisIE [Ignavibacteriales bacterium]HPP